MESTAEERHLGASKDSMRCDPCDPSGETRRNCRNQVNGQKANPGSGKKKQENAGNGDNQI